ncbi:glycoside hydrolase family 43 protein [Sinomicrobium weinanense]|uniref:Glycoside hydrolase family 43 protein n=1 Tax=Sinomicrobium weinanense TaxID=2842200 RepID=A0A926JTA4_9FLAO|nr:glycoside hydrolase family 43 protein [Sinomicrobium weinanense]MBC9797130.1 glycoside hydrolase family 43 protein [Sinomicrobium weinanense]MBU3124831.1 glycoside hydrolase family 43 protein [Sinomicrobium weinanense]
MKKQLILLFLLACGSLFAQERTFTNPLLPSGADPYSTYHNGYYYYTHTLGNKLTLWKTKNLADLKNAESKLIWTPPEGTLYSKDIWAPEFHIIDGKWYVYFAADDGDNNNHRMYVLENTSEDPFRGTWDFKGRVAAWPDRWAIDGNVFKYNDELYMIWSGWEGNTNGQQNIYIAKMKNPWTMDGKRVLIAEPTYTWEKQGDLDDEINPPHVNVNEGPQYLEHDGKIFIVFSANGCWTDYYALGLLSLEGRDILNPASWKKHPEPIFTKSEKHSVYAPGHNSFFKSPDGTEDWILYHANSNPGDGCVGKRSPRMQKIEWNKDGTPNLGIPVSEGTVLKIPSEN